MDWAAFKHQRIKINQGKTNNAIWTWVLRRQ